MGAVPPAGGLPTPGGHRGWEQPQDRSAEPQVPGVGRKEQASDEIVSRCREDPASHERELGAQEMLDLGTKFITWVTNVARFGKARSEGITGHPCRKPRAASSLR